MEGYLTTDEIARRLGIRVETVRRWVHQGKLPGLPLGRAGYRIRKEDFDSFVQNQQPQHSLPTSSAPSAPSVSPNSMGEARMEAAATLILERMTDGVLLFGLDGQCQYANRQAEQLLGLTDDLLGKTLDQVLPRNIADAEKNIDQNDYFSPATGRWYQLRIFATPQGRCISFFDISERKYQQLNAAFLSDLTEMLSSLSSQEEILQTVGMRMRQYFSVSSLTCAVVNEVADEFTVVYDSNEQDPVRVFKTQPLSDYANEDFLREMKAGHVIAVSDLLTDSRTAAYDESFPPYRVRAFLLASHVSEGQVDFVIGMQHSEPYYWRKDEIELMQELIARIYPQLERVRAEQALRASRAEIERQWQFFDTILANLRGFVFVWNRQKQFVYANQALEQLWGIEHGDAVGKTTEDLGYPPELSQLFARQIEQVFETRAAVTDEVPYTSPTGVSGYYDYILSPILESSGSVELVAGISQDTTERKRMEQALLDSEQRVQAERQRLYDLFMQAPAAIMVTKGPEHIYELLNPLAVQYLGKYRKYIGRPGREAVPEAEEQGFFDLLDTVYQTGKPFLGNEVPAQFRSNDDGTLEQMYFNFVYQPSYNAAKEIDGVLGYINNVTESVLARKRVEESEERLRALANSMPQLVWSACADGNIDFFNERIHEYAEIARNEEGIYEWQGIVHPDDLEATVRDWEHATRTGDVFEHEHRLRMKDGTYCWHLTRGVPIHDENGVISRWYGTKTDIEQIKQLEQQKNDFIGVVSHELKTPVTSAKAFAEVLENRFHRTGDEKSAALLRKMNAQMDKLTLLIGDLLDVTRIEAGKLQFREDFFAFDELVENIIEEVQRTTSHIIQREGTTHTTIYGDRERIGQVLTNLLTNAIKYSPNATTVVVTSSCTQHDVTLCVQDFGIGIARDKLPHVFERFFRETGTREDTFPGLGLGLYVASEIISRQGGRIWVESEKGQGSTFCFTLPLQGSRNTRRHEDMFVEEERTRE